MNVKTFEDYFFSKREKTDREKWSFMWSCSIYIRFPLRMPRGSCLVAHSRSYVTASINHGFPPSLSMFKLVISLRFPFFHSLLSQYFYEWNLSISQVLFPHPESTATIVASTVSPTAWSRASVSKACIVVCASIVFNTNCFSDIVWPSFPPRSPLYFRQLLNVGLSRPVYLESYKCRSLSLSLGMSIAHFGTSRPVVTLSHPVGIISIFVLIFISPQPLHHLDHLHS